MATTGKVRGDTAIRFSRLAMGYWKGERRWKVGLLTLLLLGLTVGQVVISVLINLWTQRLFDALEQRSLNRFLVLVAAAFGIVTLNVLNTMLHLRTKRRLQFGWRQWLTTKLVEEWVGQGHYQRIGPRDQDNPDGRIAEDVRIATEAAIELALSLAYCAMLLVSFASILWGLSGTSEWTIAGMHFELKGGMLYAALLYASAGGAMALLLGRPLVAATNRRQAIEADFRFGLASVRENAESIAARGDHFGEINRLTRLLGEVRKGWYRQTQALSNVTSFAAAHSVLSAAVPILVAAPRFMSGELSLGGLMQTALAFQQTVSALSWPIDNLPRVAELRASAQRIVGLRDAFERAGSDPSEANQAASHSACSPQA